MERRSQPAGAASLVDPPTARLPSWCDLHSPALALHELGIPADAEAQRVPRSVRRQSFDDAVSELLNVADPTDAERQDAEALARRIFRPDGGV
jgi:hypothetical protein